jgi:hypothetical protein
VAEPAQGTTGRVTATLAGALAALLLAGCADGLGRGTPRVDDALVRLIAAHYEALAAEEEGRCLAPVLTGNPIYSVIERDGGQIRVRVSYAYGDREAGRDVSLRRLEPETASEVPCSGFAERDVTAVREAGGWRILEMTGETRA